MTPSLQELHKELRVAPINGTVTMAGYDPAVTPFVDSKAEAKSQLEGEFRDRLFDQHELLFANETKSLLLVLQGLDCSGKNGTIKHVVIRMNPAGVRTASFTKPTEEEANHHFLWRYRQQLPGPGQLGVFDRSHYEDVLVPKVLGTVSDDEIKRRIGEINEFESDVASSGTTIVKCMLHISFDEQRERFLRRLRRDDKRWKFSEADLDTRRRWDEFQAAYGETLAATSTDHAPWLVIPADNKWYRNWVIAALLIQTLDSLGLDYPQPDLHVDDLFTRLQPPN